MFPVQVEFHWDELLVSYAARTNGLLGVEDLFKDLDISPQAFHAGNAVAVNRFAMSRGSTQNGPAQRRSVQLRSTALLLPVNCSQTNIFSGASSASALLACVNTSGRS